MDGLFSRNRAHRSRHYTMSSIDSPTEDVSTEEEFNRALGALIHNARDNDVDITGGWRADGVDELHEYGIEIYRVVASSRQP